MPGGVLPLRFRLAKAPEIADQIAEGSKKVSLVLSSLILPGDKTSEGVLVTSTSAAWKAIVQRLGQDWNVAYQIPPDKWEELIAGAFKQAGYDEVVLTPRSGDHGRDVIATKAGVGCIKIIGSVKAYAPGNLVGYDDIRALLGVMSGERDVSKGMITTTSDFPTNVAKDPFIAPFMPTRLELMNGPKLREWMAGLSKS
jgi:restriction system protein